jgi:hypothetical protein
MKFTLKVNKTVIDTVANSIRLNAVQTFTTSGQPQFDFFILTPQMQNPSAVFSASNPWTYNGKEVELILGHDTDKTKFRTVFLGDVKQVNPSYRDGTLNGYSISCTGYGNRAEKIPVVNPMDLSTQTSFNTERTNLEYDSILDGKTIGSAIQFILEGHDVAQRLNDNGFTGMYKSLGSNDTEAVLMDDLLSELSVITSRPPTQLNMSGENLIGAVQSLFESYDPNYHVIADPHERRFKIFDMRKVNNKGFVLGQDLIDRFTHNRDVSSSYKRIRIRGSANVKPYMCHWNYGADTSYHAGIKPGELEENFGYGSISNGAAKSAWKLSDYERQVMVKGDTGGVYWPTPGEYQPCASRPPGTCKPETMPGPDQIEINAASFLSNPETDIGIAPIRWGKDEWAQVASSVGGVARQGNITIKRMFRWKHDSTGAIGAPEKGQIMWQISDRFLVVANDPYPNVMSVCGTSCTYDKIRFTLDRAHGVSPADIQPPSSITSKPGDYYEEWGFELTGFNPSGANVWRKYHVNLGADGQTSGQRGITKKIMKRFPEPVPWRSSNGLSVMLVSTPQAVCVWSQDYKAPYIEWPLNFYVDREHNDLIFTPPVVRLFGTRSKLETGGFDNSVQPPWGVISGTTGNITTSQKIDGVPYDIRVLLPVADGVLSVDYPPMTANVTDKRPDGEFYYGTAARYEGLDNVMEVSMPQWVKSSDSSNMAIYAASLYESVKDTVVHGDFEHIKLLDPWVDSWHPYWLTSGQYVGSDGKVKNRPLTPTVKVSLAGSGDCETGLGVLPEDELIIRDVTIRFNEGSGGKNGSVSMSYSNQKAPWTSPQLGFDSYRQMIASDTFDFQRYGNPDR